MKSHYAICTLCYTHHIRTILHIQESESPPVVKKHKHKHKKHRRDHDSRHKKERRSLRSRYSEEEGEESEEDDFVSVKKRSKRTRKTISYKFEEYDQLMKSAIQDGVCSVDEEEGDEGERSGRQQI